MKKHFTLTTAFLFCISNFLSGQITFEKTYGLPVAYDEAYSIVRADDGDIYTLGSSFIQSNGSLDFMLSRLDSQGNERWSKTYGGVDKEEGRKLLLLEDGLLLLGYTKSFGEGSRDWYVIKTDFEGTEIWSQTYGGPDQDIAFDAALGANGDILMGGFRETGPLSGSDVWLAIIDGQGNLQADTYLATEDQDDFFCVAATADGGWLVGWQSTNNEKLTKLSSNLQVVSWELEDDAFESFFTTFTDIQQQENGDILVSGYGSFPWVAWVSDDGFVIQDYSVEEDTSGRSFGFYRTIGSAGLADGMIHLLVYPADRSGSGAVLMLSSSLLSPVVSNFFEEQLPAPYDMALTEGSSGGELYIAGRTITLNGGQDAFVLKGNVLTGTEWRTTFGKQGAVGEEFGFEVLEAEDGSFYIATGYRASSFNYFKASFLKVDPNGNGLWTIDYGTDIHSNRLIGMTLLANGHLAVLGASLPGQVLDPPQQTLFILEISPDGQIVSEATIPVISGISNGGIAALPDGGFITAADVRLDEESNEGLYLVRWGETGNILWERMYNEGGVNLIEPDDIAYSPFDQTIVCTGSFRIDSPIRQDGVFKFDIEDGSILWSASPEITGGFFSDITVGADGTIIASGLYFDSSTSPTRAGSHTYWLDASGASLNYRQYFQPGYLYYQSTNGVYSLPGNRYWTAGYRYLAPPADNYTAVPFDETVQGMLTFYDELGNLTQELLFGDEESPTVFIDGRPTDDGGFIVTGGRYFGTQDNRDAYLLKTNSDGLVSTQFTIKRDGQLMLSPNPGQGRLRFDFQHPATGEITAELYDMQGRQLWQGTFDKLEETASREVDFRSLPGGNYVFSVVIEGKRYSGQWVKMGK